MSAIHKQCALGVPEWSPKLQVALWTRGLTAYLLLSRSCQLL